MTRRAGGARGTQVGAGLGAQVSAGRACVLGVQGARGWACWALGRRRSAGGQAAARAAGAGKGARGAGRERAAWARGARSLGVPVRAGWAC